MHRRGVPDDVPEHDPEHFFKGLVAAVVDGLLIWVRSAPRAEQAAIFDQSLDDHWQVFDTRFRHRAPLVDLFLPDDMLGVGAEHGGDMSQMPSPGAFDCRITHLGERVHVESHGQ